MLKFRRLLGSKSILAMLFVVPSASSADDATLQRLMSEAPEAWRRIEQAMQGQCFEFVETLEETTVRPVKLRVSMRTTEGTAHCLNGSSRIDVTVKSSKIDVSNLKPDQASLSSLKKAPMEEEVFRVSAIANELYLASVLTNAKPALDWLAFRSDSEGESRNYSTQAKLLPGLSFVSGTPLRQCLAGMPGFVRDETAWQFDIVDASMERVASQEFAVVQLQPLGDGWNGRNVEATLRLEPARGWVVIGYQLVEKSSAGKQTNFSTCQIEYSPQRPDSFHPSKAVFIEEFGIDENTVATKRELTFASLQDSSYQISDCRLTAFGLLEPASNRGWTWLWIAGPVGLGLLGWRLHRRSDVK